MERTLVLLKPDAVQRQLVGRIIARFEAKGLKITGLKMMNVSQELAREVYKPHKGKDFYEPLMAFITSAPVVAAVLEGKDAIAVVRAMLGPTFGPDAPPGTIRGDLGMSKRYNLVHGSDSPASASREISLFFSPGELVDYELLSEKWIYARLKGELL
ncbi:MAG TPA: nucleoside-diphosphate kinase [Phycisphaerae bacterium]|nr:nucleoside-diphosphate kinase [Phycisphaerae bacterium]